MNTEIFVVGVFDCGCSYESSFGSLEVVKCSNSSEVNDIKQKMGIHSVDYQCHEREAISILVFEGKIQRSNLGKEDSKDGSGIYSYKNYVKLWDLRSKENARMESEQKGFEEKLEKEIAEEKKKQKKRKKSK